MTTENTLNTGKEAPLLKGKRCPGDVLVNSSRTSRLFHQVEVKKKKADARQDGKESKLVLEDSFDTGPDVDLDLEPLERVTVISTKVSDHGFLHVFCLRQDGKVSWYRADDDLKTWDEMTEEDWVGERMER